MHRTVLLHDYELLDSVIFLTIALLPNSDNIDISLDFERRQWIKAVLYRRFKIAASVVQIVKGYVKSITSYTSSHSAFCPVRESSHPYLPLVIAIHIALINNKTEQRCSLSMLMFLCERRLHERSSNSSVFYACHLQITVELLLSYLVR